jgi:transposase
MEHQSVGPVVAARTLADVGDIARFADRNRHAPWTGTAPQHSAASGGQIPECNVSNPPQRAFVHADDGFRLLGFRLLGW